MREEILSALMENYAQLRSENERTETERRRRIRQDYPAIETAAREREELVFQSLRSILNGNQAAENLPERMEQANRRINALLREAGLPEDYLSPVYRCSLCKDTGYCGEPVKEPCACLRKAYRQKIRETIGLGENPEETFEKYNEALIPEEPVNGSGISQRALTGIARNYCEQWADRYPQVPVRDILLTGGSGLGKTFLMRAMAARLTEREQNVLIISAYRFLQMARKNYYEAGNGVQEFTEVPILMLDDLGSEPLMQNVTVEQIFQLINERQNRGLSTIISTNLTLAELRERYTERVASRLNNPKRCMILTLAGRDLRKLEK